MTETLQEIGTLQFLSTKISKKVKKKMQIDWNICKQVNKEKETTGQRRMQQ